MLSAPGSHMKSMLRKQNPLNRGGGVCLIYKALSEGKNNKHGRGAEDSPDRRDS